ncbi:fungal-specific transcription factor domain-containing protein [Flagelloscypha sp. PMI_526]|nr:fungal-specific transcription factor domain-containing protein [Flagelloscypha sp. PMI_526]
MNETRGLTTNLHVSFAPHTGANVTLRRRFAEALDLGLCLLKNEARRQRRLSRVADATLGIPLHPKKLGGRRANAIKRTLATGEGIRNVMAATEHLHRRVAKMQARIRKLEDALADVHQTYSNDPHPLLRADLLGLNIANNPFADVVQPTPIERRTIDALGTLNITEQGFSHFLGSTGGSEVMMMLSLDPTLGVSSTHTPPAVDSSVETASSEAIKLFSHAFPFTPQGRPQEIHTLIESYLPPWDRAHNLCRQYIADISWLVKPVDPTQVFEDMLPTIYRRQEAISGEEYTSPHNLSLLFVILALGCIVEATANSRDIHSIRQEAEHYHQISKAALSVQPILEHPSIYAVQALTLLGVYNSMSGEDMMSQSNMELTWNLTTLAAHLAQAIGLHRDSARWDLPEKIVRRHRAVFWDVYIAENWNCLSNGRPPSFNPSYIDCKFPEPDGPMSYETWQYLFARDCVAETVSQACASRIPTYESIMELDKKVREYPLPDLSASGLPETVIRFQKGICSYARNIILLFIHRSLFAQAIIDEPSNPLKSDYAPSFVAVFRASSQILRDTVEQFRAAPSMTSRWWMSWSFAFSAGLVFAMVVTNGPHSLLANLAMKELDLTRDLFTQAAPMSHRASKCLSILNRLHAKARAALASSKGDSDFGSGVGSMVDDDDLFIFGGYTRLVSGKQRILKHPVDAEHSAIPTPLLPAVPSPPTGHFGPPEVPRLHIDLSRFTPSQSSSHSSPNSRDVSQVRAFFDPAESTNLSNQPPISPLEIAVSNPISTIVQQGDVYIDECPRDAHGSMNWQQSSMNVASAQDLQSGVTVPPTPFDYGQAKNSFLAAHNEPLQSYGEKDSSFMNSPSDFSVMGIAGVRTDENFPMFVTNSGILDSEANAQGWEN